MDQRHRRAHRRHEPQPFTLLTVWHTLWEMTGRDRSPVTAAEVAASIRADIPHSVTGARTTHNDEASTRAWIRQLILMGAAEEGAQRPSHRPDRLGRRATLFRAIIAPDGSKS